MMIRNTLAILVLLAVHAVSSPTFGYSCVARASGKNCGGSYNGYSSSSKGQAIQDALNNCRSSAPSNCTCSLGSCSNRQAQDDGLDDIINPIGEHDHFIGTVTVMPTGARAYPDVHSEMALLSISWASAKEKASKLVAALESESVVTRAFPLKTSPKVEWFFACPQGNNACKCNSGHTFSHFSAGKEEAKAQKFNFVVTPSRIDVNDMKITRQDGSVYFAKGKYEVDMDVKFTNGNTYSCNLISQGATKTGLDVLRGFRYVVTTTAISEEGSTLQSIEEIDLR